MGLKHCLQLFPVLFEPLLTASNPLLQAIAANLQNEGLSQLLEDINRVSHQCKPCSLDVMTKRNHSHINRTHH